MKSVEDPRFPVTLQPIRTTRSPEATPCPSASRVWEGQGPALELGGRPRFESWLGHLVANGVSNRLCVTGLV